MDHSSAITSPPPAVPPEWWERARALEAADQLEEATEVIAQAVPHQGFAASIAQLYAGRMHRLLREGNRPAAREAFRQASNWITFHASQATSGGEGMALSRERDTFRADLLRSCGDDPTWLSA